MFVLLKESFLSFVKEKIFLLFLVCFLLGVAVSFFALETFKKAPLWAGVAAGDSSSSEPAIATEDSVNFPKSIVADLSGAIKIPGVYRLTEGARLVDLLALGGGVSNEASGAWVSRNLNLSRKLTDAEKVYIPFEWEVTVDSVESVASFVDLTVTARETTSAGNVVNGSQTPISARINVNTASAESLDTLPGIGAVYAQKIVSGGPYKDINDLQTRTKIAASALDKIKDLIVFQ